jgi:hypothetical protein
MQLRQGCQPFSGAGSTAECPSVTPSHGGTHLEASLMHLPMSFGPFHT